MSELRSFGLKSTKMGDIPDDGTMSVTLAAIALTYKGSATLKEADPTITDIYVEEEDFPVESFDQMGNTVLAFSILDLTPETLQKLKGGTLVGGSWNAPRAVVDIEQSLQVITKRNVLIEIPRAKVRAVLNFQLGQTLVSLVDIKATCLLPQNEAVGPIAIGPYPVATVSAGADQPGVVLNHANLVGTAVANRGDILSQLWTLKSKPVGAANPGITTPAALATAITALSDGVYVFTLTAIDTNGVSSSDDVAVTVAL